MIEVSRIHTIEFSSSKYLKKKHRKIFTSVRKVPISVFSSKIPKTVRHCYRVYAQPILVKVLNVSVNLILEYCCLYENNRKKKKKRKDSPV